LKVAAKVDRADRDYYEQKIRPLIQASGRHVAFIGEVGGQDKDEFLRNASALLFPIDWPEPFGLVMIEAMACGTPVIAYRRGSVPEVIDDGVTGFLVEDLDQAVRAVARVVELRRSECRRVFEERFSAARMAHDYLKIYRQLLKQPNGRAPRQSAAASSRTARSNGKVNGSRQPAVSGGEDSDGRNGFHGRPASPVHEP
jgi:glycosyltransferase involved in cell wall biosynthesis